MDGLTRRLKLYALPALILVVGILVSGVFYSKLQELDQKRIEEQFRRIGQNQSKHLQWNLTNYRNALHSAVDLFRSQERVRLGDFRRIAGLIQERYPEVLALEWLPKVTDKEREAFVQNIRREYDIEFGIKSLYKSGKIGAAESSEVYYPVTYIQPFYPYNQELLGLDHLSHPPRRKALEKARNQGSITVTSSLKLLRLGPEERRIRSPENNLGVILYKPVFETSQQEGTVEDQHEKPKGVIGLSLKIQSVMAPIFETESFNHNVAVIEHPSNPKNPSARIIYSNKPPGSVKQIAKNNTKITYKERFPFSDRSWSVLLWPTDRYLNQHRSWGPWLAFGFGLLFTVVSARGVYWFSEKFIGQQREFQSVVNSAEDAIISTNADLSIRLWNNSAERIFGYEEKEVRGKPLTAVFHEDETQRLRQFMTDLEEDESEDPDNRMREFRGCRSNGTSFPVELTFSSWSRQGKTIFTIIIRDISDRKQREKRLEELTENLEQQVEKRTEELEQFVRAASHDLREPARVMETYTGFLEEDLGSDLDDNIRKDLRFIRDSARQMNDLIDSLLSLSRIGRNELETQLIDVGICVDQALEQQEELLQSKDVTIERDILPEISADPALLTDIYQNLISNAIKHADDNAVTISLTAEKNNGHWILGVQDDGPGIDPEFQETIFKPFKYLKQSKDHDGIGIGLTICRRIVEHHGGDIWVTSQPAGGSHFQFTLE